MKGGVSAVNCLSLARITRMLSSSVYKSANSSPVTVLIGIACADSGSGGATSGILAGAGLGGIASSVTVGGGATGLISGFLKPFSSKVELTNSSSALSWSNSVCSSLTRFCSMLRSSAVFRILSSSGSLSSAVNFVTILL